MLEPVARCFTTQVAEQITSLRADPEVQERIDALAEKANEGELTASEREEYEAYVEAMDFIAILQAKAHSILARQANS